MGRNLITDYSFAKRILKEICKVHNIEINNVVVDKKYKYILTIDCSKPDADYKSIVRGDIEYSVRYVSGCFYPYIVAEYIQNKY